MGKLPYFLRKKNTVSSLYSGQTLLLVLLSMAVVLTVVLSILSRSITDVAITSRQEESQRAFSAAEAGIESALIGASLDGALGNEANYSADVSDYGVDGTFVYPIGLASGESATIWFVSHDNDDGTIVPSCDVDNPCFSGQSIDVCWGNLGGTTALEMVIFYTSAASPWDYSTTKIARVALDSQAGARSNYFDSSVSTNCNLEGQDFAFKKTVNFGDLGISYSTPGVLKFALVRLLYNTSPEKFGIEAGAGLPSQGLLATSIGTAGESTRKVEVFQSYSEIPGIFQTAVFSQGGLVK